MITLHTLLSTPLDLHSKMARGRRHSARLPALHLFAQLKLDTAAVDKHILMLKPILGPIFAIHLETLHVEALVEAGGGDVQGFVAVDRHVDLGEPGRADEVDWLGHDGIQAYELPEQP